MRLGNMYGPDATFLGVPAADLDDPSSYANAAGRDHRRSLRRRHLASAGLPFRPQAIRLTDYLPHDGSRPHLALDVDPLVELGVVDVGDVEMLSGETDQALARLEAAVLQIARSGALPIVLGGDHTIALPDVTGSGASRRVGPSLGHPLRRPRGHR
jgi:agmatinase